MIQALDVASIYEVPSAYHAEGLDREVLAAFGITNAPPPDLERWRQIAETIANPDGEVTVAANIDTVFIVSGLDGGRNFNLRRIERYLTLAWSSGAVPVVVLNKVDLCSDVDELIRSVETIAPGISIYPVSAKEHLGLDALRSYLIKGSTAAFLGSSGVGKSSLINSLLGLNKQETAEVREDNRMGRVSTTTTRELIPLPTGGMVIDTPG